MSNLNASYDAWYEQKIADQGHAWLQPWHVSAAKFLPNLNRRSILEIGCGTGEFAFWLLEKYPDSQVTAVDFSETAIRAALNKKGRLEKQPRFGVEDAQQLSFKPESFRFRGFL
jgi:ubiquinone/menaquinone biosynthesis C-methylase UbiE